MRGVLECINRVVWGVPTLVLILGVGLYISVRTLGVQIRLFPKAISQFFRSIRGKSGKDSVSSYQALCTALAATVGTGNLAGVAGAIALGGPGAIFWMWIFALLGMATKFAEASLAVRFRVRSHNGEYTGGPMYMIRGAMPRRWHWLAGVYCFFGVVAAFGVGNATQINAVLGGIHSVMETCNIAPSRFLDVAIGLVLAFIIGRILLGGAKGIAGVTEKLVPFAALFYIILCVGVFALRWEFIGSAFVSILHGAFSPGAVTGGIVGSALVALRVGASRGTFTNEAGMGTASIAHGGADTDHPVNQGMMGIVEVFLDTIVICTMTALVILCSGIPIPYGVDVGVSLTLSAFSNVFGNWSVVAIAIALCAFAVATVIGWGLYGMRCAQYLFGDGAWRKFVIIQSVTVVIGAVMNTGTVWMLSEIVNALMAIPNLIVLIYLTPKLKFLIQNYKIYCGKNTAAGGTYENFNQCQPLRTVSYAEISPIGGKGGSKWKENIPSQHRSA